MAVFTLPTDIAGFYKDHIVYLTESAVNADKRRYVDPDESVRHFIDADDYGKQPFDSIPVHWKAAVDKYTENRLYASGILPWQINWTYYRLVDAFSEKDLPRILRHSADLGHYIADAHVPLHTTSNYNGQLTDQVGIHAFWESHLPELFAGEYDFFVGRAQYISSPLAVAWQIVKESFSLVDSVLAVEAQLHQQVDPDLKYTYIERNNILIRTYSPMYSQRYHEALSGMVTRRMRGSIINTGNFWYSAWVDAGQPDIRHLDKLVMDPDSLITPASEQQILGREEWKE